MTLFRLRFELFGPRGREGPGTHFRTLFATLGPKGPNDPCSGQKFSQRFWRMCPRFGGSRISKIIAFYCQGSTARKRFLGGSFGRWGTSAKTTLLQTTLVRTPEKGFWRRGFPAERHSVSSNVGHFAEGTMTRVSRNLAFAQVKKGPFWRFSAHLLVLIQFRQKKTKGGVENSGEGKTYPLTQNCYLRKLSRLF